MAHPLTPAELHRAAADTWRNFTHDSSERSLAYLIAEELIVTPSSPNLDALARRPMNWVHALHRYERFWREHRRRPRENTRDRRSLLADERRLAEWARYQRRIEDDLVAFQRIRLDVSEAFAWDPHDADWQANLHACSRFLEVTGRLPRLNADDCVEFVLARWLNRQLRQTQGRSLPHERHRPLDDLLRRSRLE